MIRYLVDFPEVLEQFGAAQDDCRRSLTSRISASGRPTLVGGSVSANALAVAVAVERSTGTAEQGPRHEPLEIGRVGGRHRGDPFENGGGTLVAGSVLGLPAVSSTASSMGEFRAPKKVVSVLAVQGAGAAADKNRRNTPAGAADREAVVLRLNAEFYYIDKDYISAKPAWPTPADGSAPR